MLKLASATAPKMAARWYHAVRSSGHYAIGVDQIAGSGACNEATSVGDSIAPRGEADYRFAHWQAAIAAGK
jgi:hypothetical protein